MNSESTINYMIDGIVTNCACVALSTPTALLNVTNTNMYFAFANIQNWYGGLALSTVVGAGKNFRNDPGVRLYTFYNSPGATDYDLIHANWK